MSYYSNTATIRCDSAVGEFIDYSPPLLNDMFLLEVSHTAGCFHSEEIIRVRCCFSVHVLLLDI